MTCFIFYVVSSWGLTFNSMKYFISLVLVAMSFNSFAQETITYPYNPDGDVDGTVALPDLLDLLGVYGGDFSPGEIMIGDTALSAWIQILYQALEDQQAVVEGMQWEGGCDISFPEGKGNHILIDVNYYNPYTVPMGKRLYIVSSGGGVPYMNGAFVQGYTPSNLGEFYEQPIILNSGEILTGSGLDTKFNCMLIDETQEVMGVTDLISSENPYIVPEGKELFLLTWTDYSLPRVNGVIWYTSYPLRLSSGDILSSYQVNPHNFNGYLVDEDYFDGCGGDGLSASSGLDSTAVANMIASSGGNMAFGDRIPVLIDWSGSISGNPVGSATIDYTAPSDGFLTGIIDCADAGLPVPVQVQFYSDTVSNPNVLRGEKGVQYPTNGYDKSSFNFPIKQGEIYRFSRTSYEASPTVILYAGDVTHCYFTPLSSGGGSSSTPVLNNETVILDLSNFLGLDCDSINNLNYGDIVINAQGQTSIVVPGESCGGVSQNSGSPPYINPQSLFPVSSRNYYCFFTVNDTIVLTSTPQFYTTGVYTLSSIVSYGEFTIDFDPNITNATSYINNSGGFLLPGYIYSLQGGTADLSYQNTATNIFQSATSSFNLNPEMFNELGLYTRIFGDSLIYPTNNFGLTTSGFTYSPFGKKLKNF